jgi:hypothetical protein
MDAMIKKMTNNWEANYKRQIIYQLILHADNFPITLGCDEQRKGNQDLDVDKVCRIKSVVEILTDDHDRSGDVTHQHD